MFLFCCRFDKLSQIKATDYLKICAHQVQYFFSEKVHLFTRDTLKVNNISKVNPKKLIELGK